MLVDVIHGITNGADVRVAGANVGSIDGIYVGKDGLASVILDIKDPAFQTFYRDAVCRIRLQSLIGEKFVDCDPGTPSKGELPQDPADDSRVILNHNQTGSPVDPDELLDAMREPQRERFRVIINELGGYPVLFATSGVVTVLGALSVYRIRSVR